MVTFSHIIEPYNTCMYYGIATVSVIKRKIVNCCCCSSQDLSKDAVDEMLSVDDETADALAEFDFVMGEDSGSETDVTVIEMEDNTAVLEDMDINMPEEGEYPAPQGKNCSSCFF